MSKTREKKQQKDGKKTVVSIKTFGCQMNMYDTEVAEGLLLEKGYELFKEEDYADSKQARRRRPIEHEADVVLMNTCSVREHAEDRVYSRLGMLGKIKKQRPEMVIGLMGCMVEEHREKLFRRFPHLDLMVGTRNIKEIPGLVEQVRQNRQQVAKIKQDGISIEYTDQIKRQGKYHAWLPIMTGCNKVCTFCIVPITRGSEVSMPARDVYREASRLVDDGVKWITLLGQNVNSYDGKHEGGSQVSFPQLLDMLCQIEGLERISFTTSHPQDATPELYEVIARNPKISRRFHLPLQSGSDRMLKRMKRLHNYEEYKAKIDLMREMIPDVSITTDIIAGFSGETDEDHQLTAKALEEIRYDGAYIYKYSVRPGTPADKLEDDVAFELKSERNNELLAIQDKISEEVRQADIGKTFKVFVENQNWKNPTQLRGRSSEEKIIAFDGDANLLGTFQMIKVDGVSGETLIGHIVDPS